jgi:hypothetical protein
MGRPAECNRSGTGFGGHVINSGVAFAIVIVASSPARADVIPMPPDNCPEGYTPSSSHSGPTCLAPAPKDCPSGWRGVLGGGCALDLCEADRDCQGGRRCVSQSLCFVERIPHWREFATEPDYRARWVCGGALSCRSPAECRSGKLCLEPGARRGADSPNPNDRSEAAELTGCSGCRRRQPVRHELTAASALVLGASLWRWRRRR